MTGFAGIHQYNPCRDETGASVSRSPLSDADQYILAKAGTSVGAANAANAIPHCGLAPIVAAE